MAGVQESLSMLKSTVCFWISAPSVKGLHISRLMDRSALCLLEMSADLALTWVVKTVCRTI